MAEATAANPPPESPARGGQGWTYADLFLISFAILFLELACIRWFASTVVFLTFFTNLVLMACFLGMSVGLLSTSRRLDVVNAVIPLTFLAAALAYGVLWGYHAYAKVTIDVGGQESPQQIFFGTEVRTGDPSQFVIPIEVVAGGVFALIALIFVGLGQAMGRRFNALPNRVLAYTTNVFGSLAGLAAFGLASWFRLPPIVWFAVGLGPIFAFATRRRGFQLACFAGVLGIMAYDAYSADDRSETAWSPYYKVGHDKKARMVYVNNIFHQSMVDSRVSGLTYALPHLMNRDAGGPPFEDVLVIGAGTGNDVAAALAYGAKHVDAVEIDPQIYEIGRAHHPDRPYEDPRVTVHLDDGRRVAHTSERQYDLVVYALVDSLVLHSGYSSLRLESFLFTEQAFRDIKARLKPGGVFAMYNFYRQGWVVGRLKTMAEEVFGAEPIVVSVPYQERIASGDAQEMHLTVLLAGGAGSEALDGVRRALQEDRFFWAHVAPRFNRDVNAYGPAPPSVPGVASGFWQKIGTTEVDTRGIGRTPSDDWPFLYLREPTIPMLNLRGMAIVAGLSLAILFLFAPKRAARPSGRMFFLGAGFMLLETKGVAHMALLFGSTWVVNSVVFAAILVMILLSNLFVMTFRPRRLWPAYALLLAALLVNAAVPMTVFLALPGAARMIVSCLVVFLPIAFAGVIFAATFRDSTRPDVDLGSNIGGVILGGLSENLSLVVGFNQLLYLAIAYYALSAVLEPKLSAPAAVA